jgi:hypothetical protein
MDTNISGENVIFIFSINRDNEDSLLRPGIGVERPTRYHTSDVYSLKNYGFANFI